MEATPTTTITNALHVWIRQRPGLEPGNYISGWHDTEGRRAYRAEVRSITRDLHDARALLAYVERNAIYAEDLTEAFRSAYSGRLSWDGVRLDYCTGQYWPTEYRRAVCAVLASAIWYYWRDSMKPEDTDKADKIRKTARLVFGRGIASRWFR